MVSNNHTPLKPQSHYNLQDPSKDMLTLQLPFVRTAIVALAVVFTFAPAANAVGCFSGGQVGDCSGSISSFCNDLNGFVFSAGQEVSKCYDFTGYRCNMKAVNTGGGGSTIGVQQCINDQTATNNGCNGHGGIRADGNFELTLDPNSGAC